MKGVLGDAAPVSAGLISRLREKWQVERSAWRARDLSPLEPVYAGTDSMHVKTGLEDLAVLLVVLSALADASKVFVAVEPGHRESTESGSSVLRDFKARGLKCPSCSPAKATSALGRRRSSGPESPTPTQLFVSATDAAKHFKRVRNATTIIWKLLMLAVPRARQRKRPQHTFGPLERRLRRAKQNAHARARVLTASGETTRGARAQQCSSPSWAE